MSDAAEGADQVDADRQLELVHRVALELAGRLVLADGLGGVGDAGAVDQDPLLPMGGAGLVERGRDLLVARHIDLAEDAADLGRDFLALVGVAVEDRDLGALGGQRPRGRLAEARCAAGDDCCCSVDFHSISPRHPG